MIVSSSGNNLPPQPTGIEKHRRRLVHFFLPLWVTFGVQQVCPETNTVIINIGLLLLAFSNLDEERCRYSSSPPLQLYLPVTSFTFTLHLQAQHIPFQPPGQLGLKHRRVLYCRRRRPYCSQRPNQVGDAHPLFPCFVATSLHASQ